MEEIEEIVTFMVTVLPYVWLLYHRGIITDLKEEVMKRDNERRNHIAQLIQEEQWKIESICDHVGIKTRLHTGPERYIIEKIEEDK